MGQGSFSCQNAAATPRNQLSRQLSIYKWRSSQAFGKCISGVRFKNAHEQKGQQKFSEFLKSQEDSQYLEVYKFKEYDSFPQLKGEQVISFEKYQCSLRELTGMLNIEQLLYAMYSLLVGYQEIRKVLQVVVIDENCCFITHDGTLRTWINPNYRSNEVWTHEGAVPESTTRVILAKIVAMSERMALRSTKNGQFFKIINAQLSKTKFKHYSFVDLRRTINEFCYRNNIVRSVDLSRAVAARAQKHGDKSYKRQSRKTDNTVISKHSNTLYVSTLASQHHSPSLFKTKSLAKQNNITLHNSTCIEREPSRKSSIAKMQNSNNSQTIQKPETLQNMFRKSEGMVIHQKDHHGQVNLLKKQNINKMQKTGHFFSKENTTVNQAQLKNRSFERGRDSVHLTSKMEKVRVSEESFQISKLNWSHCSHKLLEESIIKHVPVQNTPPSFTRPDHNYKTCLVESKSGEDDEPRSQVFQKTVTRLISQNQDSSQLKESFGESSNYYNSQNGSVYSGVLTQMGRDIVPLRNQRTRTVRLSKQV